MYQAVAEFSRLYPETSINIVNGTHEELYDLVRSGKVDLILNDQRRAFSDMYVNFPLLRCSCCIELSSHNPLSSREYVQVEELKRIPCILISSKEQQNEEQEYYKTVLGFGGSFLFAENLEEGRLMVASNRGFLPLGNVGTLPPEGASIRRLPLYRGEQPLMRNYCLFWDKKRTNYYIEEFAQILQTLIAPERQC